MQVIQVLLIVFALFALSRVVLRFKDNKLTKGEFIFWALIWLGIIIIGISPNIIIFISHIVGIKRGIDVAIYVSIVVLFYLMFRLYVKLETMGKELTSVVRKVALKKENDSNKGKRK